MVILCVCLSDERLFCACSWLCFFLLLALFLSSYSTCGCDETDPAWNHGRNLGAITGSQSYVVNKLH